MEEIWMSVKGWESYYEVSDMGRIRAKAGRFTASGRVGKVRFLKFTPDKDGYLKVTLYDRKSNRGYYRVHRIVAESFLSDFRDDFQVHHIDGDKANNCVSNLQMMSCSQHHKKTWEEKGSREHIQKIVSISRERRSVKCEVTDKRNGETRTFNSLKEASRFHGRSDRCMAEILKEFGGENRNFKVKEIK